MYVSEDNLMGLPFDAEKLKVTGEPKPIATKIGAAQNTYAFSVTTNGTLLYQTNNKSSMCELIWVDRTGKKIQTIGQQGKYGDIALSPDESRLAYASLDYGANSMDIWIYDLKRNVPTRLTFDPGIDAMPVWSPDGQMVYFGSDRGGQFFKLYRKGSNGLGDAELVYGTDSSHIGPSDITPDGTRMLIHQVQNGWNIGILYMNDSNRVDNLVNSSYYEAMGQVSPNGQYVAYVSTESGNRQVYVRKLDGTGGKWQISTEHADSPKWNGDGTELYYLATDSQMMAVKVNAGATFEAGKPVELFKCRLQSYSNLISPYDVTTDGQRFLLNARLSDSDPGEIVVVQNWAQEFKDR